MTRLAFKQVFSDATRKATKIPAKQYKKSGKYPIIDQSMNAIAGYADSTEGLYSDVPAIVFGDHTRAVKYAERPFFIGADGTKVLKQVREEDNLRYLFHALRAVDLPDEGYTRHFKWLKECTFRVPDAAEQRRIAKILDSVQGQITLADQMLEKADALIQSRFIEMFGDPVDNPRKWQKRYLKSLGTLKNGLNFKRSEQGESIRVIGVSDFGSRTSISSYEKVPFVSLASSPAKECFLEDGDILFVRSNGNKKLVGRNMIVNSPFERVAYSGFCIRLRITAKEVTPFFVNSLLSNHELKQQLLGSTRGANISNLSQGMLAELPIIVPPLALQNQFAEFVTSVELLKSTITAECDRLRTLYDSLAQQYFA
ncbi:hypothetical protein CS006_05680 [Bifidobacterium primatium]|uniref:Type I restriction modification DNA specificity domain-containing protein n=2 Tax=Bifidobacterium TaxID=1678 RepID=A0A2M9H9P7_9BIFI|nr:MULTISPECIES: restriction endonuclease subunit S [Bifidobacterium]NEG96732.1 restriction endonuclease subunit S [Bifidobacterium sp. SMB2]NEH11888.1 restriction endonuclease subunit S [Bifidobacterium saimiriisciurei]PJM73519.1 hypothetical protein CS006_05680 [Bifidobacterium primatium]